MPYARYNGQGELRHIGGKVVVVERGEVACGASASDYHYGVERISLGGHALQGFDDAARRLFALHHGFEKP